MEQQAYGGASTISSGRSSSFRLASRSPTTSADSSTKSKSSSSGYTSALMNWAKPFRKSRDESDKITRTTMSRIPDSPSDRSSQVSLISERSALSTKAKLPLAGSNRPLAAKSTSNASLKCSTSSLAPNKVNVSLHLT